MKEGIHPKNYRLVVFKDMSNGFTFMTRSTAPSKETIKMDDGKEYPLIKLEITSTSHPFYTGKKQLIMDRGGRIEQFNRRYGGAEEATEGATEEAATEGGGETAAEAQA